MKYKKLTHIILVLSLFLSTWLSQAQVYPVQVSVQMIPPYEVHLSEYQTSLQDKLIVNLLLTDVNVTNRQVKLKMYIEGNGLQISSVDNVVGATPLFLDGGINTRLTNIDLSPYFQLQNLQGITPQQYQDPLPDGQYNFCFEVYDYLSGQLISQKSCTSALLMLNDPPFLNTPDNNELVSAQTPQNVLFTWTPRHVNAINVEYEFTLKEILDTIADPQIVFMGSPVLHQTTTPATTLLYGPGEPTLIEGHTYAWQVRASMGGAFGSTSLFRNDGYSEIYTFKYVANCDPPQMPVAQVLNSENVKILWQPSNHLRYKIQYRKQGMGAQDWFSVLSYNNEAQIHNLEAETTYEYRVGGECIANAGFSYSGIYTFTTPDEASGGYYNCGILPDINITNQNLLPQLGVNEVFTAGDFPVTVQQISGNNGTFSGEGTIGVPFLSIGLKVKFQNIKINTDYQLIDGKVITDYDASWSNIGDIDQVINNIAGDSGNINTFDASDTDIDSIQVDVDATVNNVTLIDENNNQTTITTGLPVVITDQNNDVWVIDEQGNVTNTGQQAEGGAATAQNTNGMSSGGQVSQITSSTHITFKTDDSFAYYSIDKVRNNTSQAFKNEYEKIPIAGGGDYEVVYKLISNQPKDMDSITAVASFSGNITKDSIVFKTTEGINIPARWQGNTAVLKLQKRFDFAKEQILATVKQGDTAHQDIAGKLNLWHAKQTEVNVTLVPVGNFQINDAVKDSINDIYNRAGIKFNIQIAGAWTPATTDWDTTTADGKLEVENSGLLANYTAEQRHFIAAYKTAHPPQTDRYYIFVLDSIQASISGVDGFMPLKRQFGFVFKHTQRARTIAHELGHGVFGLKHPFDEYNFAPGSTDLLMDYGNGTAFTHMDWQKMHAPGLQLYWFQGDDEGEQYNIYSLLVNIKAHKGTADYKINFIRDYAWEPLDGDEDDLFLDYPLKSKDIIDLDDDGIYESITTYVIGRNELENKYYTIDLSKEGTTFKSCNMSYKVSNNEKNYFKLNFHDVNDKEVFYFKAYDFDTFEKLLGYLGMSLKPSTISNIVIKYETEIQTANNDCNKLDYLFEGIGETISNNLSKESLWASLSALSSCSMVESTGTKEETAAINIIKGFNDYQYLYNQLYANPQVCENLLNKIDDKKSLLLNTIYEQFKLFDNNDIKWHFINKFISNDYDEMDETLQKDALVEFFTTMYPNNNNKIIDAVNLFSKMLNRDCEDFSDYEKVFDIALLGADHRALFSSFTEGETLAYSTHIFDPEGLVSPANNWSWIIPRDFSFIDSDNNQINYQQADVENKYPWAGFLRDNPNVKALYGTDNDAYLGHFKTQFLSYVNQVVSDNQTFWTSNNDVNCTNLATFIDHINLFESSSSLKNVSTTIRMDLIDKYFTCSNSNNQINFDEASNVILKLVASFDEDDSSVLTKLEAIGLDTIINSDRWSGSDLYKFFMWIAGQVINSGHADKLKEEYILDTNGNIKSTLLLQLESDMFRFDNFSANVNNNIFTVAGHPIPYNQLVAVQVTGDFTFLDQLYKQGTVLNIPMIQAYAMSNSNRAIVATKTAWTTLDLVLLASGIGEIKVVFSAGRFLRSAIITSDLIGGTAGMVVNAMNENAISPSTRHNIQMLALVASAPQMLRSIRVVDNMITSIDNEIDLITNVNRRAKLKNYFSKIKLKLANGGGIKFSRSFINSLDGFSDDIASLASGQGLSIEDFKLLQQKRYDVSEMSAIEMSKIDAIRSSIPLPNSNTILQKVIPKSDIQKYLDGTYNTVGGFVTTAKDAKHLSTFDDVYYGMRLDYNGTPFNLSDGSYGVIRYKTITPNATVPKLPNVSDPPPFTGNGFTGGTNGKLGVPEWKTPYNIPVDGAELWEVSSDGTETLKAVFNANQNKFIAIP